MRTEYAFTLPRGLETADGQVHREGTMRLATARDEIIPLQDYRVQSNRAYLVIILLSRVVTQLGDVDRVTVEIIENLVSTDLAYLQEFYRKINEEQGTPTHHVACPQCATEFDIDMVSGAVIAEGAEGGEGRPPG